MAIKNINDQLIKKATTRLWERGGPASEMSYDGLSLLATLYLIMAEKFLKEHPKEGVTLLDAFDAYSDLHDRKDLTLTLDPRAVIWWTATPELQKFGLAEIKQGVDGLLFGPTIGKQ